MKTRLLLFAVAAISFSSRLTAQSEVKGTFIGDRKSVKLAFISAQFGPKLLDHETFVLVLTEKDHSQVRDPDKKALSGHFGSALIVTIASSDGMILGCKVAHTALANRLFEAFGSVTMVDFKKENGEMRGRITTSGKAQSSNQTWELDITFEVAEPIFRIGNDKRSELSPVWPAI